MTSQPVPVGENVAIYAVVRGVYQIMVIDPVDGHTVWQALASPGATSPGMVLQPTVAGNDVVYLAPVDLNDNYFRADVVVSDGASGEVRARSENPYFVGDVPAECGSEIC